jgi:uncharacterized protein
MLIQFTTENFLSFKDPATLSMVAGKIRSKNKVLDADATFALSDELKLLKCALVYVPMPAEKAIFLRPCAS